MDERTGQSFDHNHVSREIEIHFIVAGIVYKNSFWQHCVRSRQTVGGFYSWKILGVERAEGLHWPTVTFQGMFGDPVSS